MVIPYETLDNPKAPPTVLVARNTVPGFRFRVLNKQGSTALSSSSEAAMYAPRQGYVYQGLNIQYEHALRRRDPGSQFDPFSRGSNLSPVTDGVSALGCINVGGMRP